MPVVKARGRGRCWGWYSPSGVAVRTCCGLITVSVVLTFGGEQSREQAVLLLVGNRLHVHEARQMTVDLKASRRVRQHFVRGDG